MNTTVRLVRGVVRKALDDAVLWGLLATNPRPKSSAEHSGLAGRGSPSSTTGGMVPARTDVISPPSGDRCRSHDGSVRP